jgi:hypothetical protein
MSVTAPPGLLDRFRGLDPEQHARRLAPAGVVFVLVGVGVGGGVGAAATLLGVALLLASCVSREHGLLVFGPFVRWELVRAARARRPPALWRALYAAAALALLGLTYLAVAADDFGEVPPPQRLPRVATAFFAAFVVLQFVYLGVLAVQLLAPVVAEEREAKRLDFLLTSDLRNREILCGKAAGRLPQLLDPVLASLPVLALLPLFGGVPPEFAVFATAATLATVLGIAGVAFFASAVSPNRDTAVGMTAGLLMAYVTLSGMARMIARWPTVWGFPASVGVASPVTVADVILAFGAGNPLLVAVQTGLELDAGADPAATVTRAVRWYAVFQLGVGGIFGLMAAARLRAVVVRNPPTGPPKLKPVLPRPPVGDDPVFWAEAYRVPQAHPAGGWRKTLYRHVLAGAAIAGVIQLVVYLGFEPDPLFAERITTMIAVMVAGGAVLAAAGRATHCVVRERTADTLTALLLTGLGCREVLRQKWRAYAYSPFGVYAMLAGVLAAGVAAGGVYPLAAVGVAAAVPFHIAAGTSLGLYCSVRAVNPKWATLLVLAAGWVVLMAAAVTVKTATAAGVEHPGPGVLAAGGAFWLALCAAAGVVFWRLAVRRFEREWEGRP